MENSAKVIRKSIFLHYRKEEEAIHAVTKNTQITNRGRYFTVYLIPSKDAKFRHLKEDAQNSVFIRGVTALD